MSQLRQKRHFEVEFFEFVYSPLNLIPKRPVYCFLLDGILIDTAQSNMVRFFRKCFQEKQIDQVLITHFHEDHSGNIPVVQEWGKPVYAHPIGVELLKKPEKLPIVERWVWGESAAVSVNPITGSVESDKFKLEFIHTPGHSPDHLCFIEKNRGWLFCGDLYVHSYIRYFMSNEDMDEQITSLHKILEYDFEVLFCSHNPQLKEGRQRMKEKLAYLEDFYGKVSMYYYEGLAKDAIMHRMNHRENKLLKYLSGGRLSAKNMISSVVQTEQKKLFKSILTENLIE